jgi:hypothetical protein
MKLTEVNPFQEIPFDYSNERQMRTMEVALRALNFQRSHISNTLTKLKEKMRAEYCFGHSPRPEIPLQIVGSLYCPDTPENRKLKDKYLQISVKWDDVLARIKRLDVSHKRLEKKQPGYVPDPVEKKRVRFR